MREYFQLCFTLLRLSYYKMRAYVRDWTLFRLKKLYIIINDDFFEEGECYGQALYTVNSALLLKCNQSLTTTLESRLFGSVIRALFFYRGGLGSIPSQGEYFQLCFTLLGYHVVRIFKCTPYYFLSWKQTVGSTLIRLLLKLTLLFAVKATKISSDDKADEVYCEWQENY